MASIAQRRKKYPISSISYHILHRIQKEPHIEKQLMGQDYKLHTIEDLKGKKVKVITINDNIEKTARCTYINDKYISIRIYEDNFKQKSINIEDVKKIYFKDENPKEDECPSEEDLELINELYENIPHDIRKSEKKSWDYIKDMKTFNSQFRKKDFTFFIKNKLYEHI